MNKSNGPFPTELLLAVFSYLDGPTLVNCSQVCKAWSTLIVHYDDLIWPNACGRDFESPRRFWSLQFPKPQYHYRWQDMYRITKNWYTGHCKGFYPTLRSTREGHASTVIGAPQEQGMFTSLSLSLEGRVIRSNPNYHSPSHPSSLMIQSPHNNYCFSFLDPQLDQPIPGWTDPIRSHAIVCHYSHTSSPWLVTGGLNGTVAVWDLKTKKLARMWHGHRGRVLCIHMNEDVVVSGGSDNMILVWDLDHRQTWTNHHRPTRRGMINISSYLSGRSDWYQGVGEIAVNGHLIACAPDASGPILVFSLLTGSLVYELRMPEDTEQGLLTEDITAFTRLCLTPFFLLTKGKVTHTNHSIKLVPSNNVVVERKKQTSAGYITKLSDSKVSAPAASQMTPYQLYQYYQSIHHTQQQQQEVQIMPQTSACINVWDLQTGKIAYRLLPTLDYPSQNYTLTDVRVTPDFSKVFASIEIRKQNHYEERLYCWDFSIRHQDSPQDFDILELDSMDIAARKTGKSWVCFI
ncbi:WD40-repeat-containing domain protein [Gilbertella persicaria]|uniref:WD40-repeat-containing domain protein n=1 Tax=Gilbertella persicaria TaxID=101096 RepID=UPI00221E7FDE|nr:WD40-repeat-containing domain protein [Gilbertella persicaria]KAI8094930.1 WD40-repeat-containing domain protein [Gilbertella persicaria]